MFQKVLYECQCLLFFSQLNFTDPIDFLLFFACNVPQNGNPQNPYCDGIEGVMEAYYRSLKSVQLYGPTNFAPVINHVAR